MRLRALMLMMALTVAAASPCAWAQSQQGQGDTASSQPATAKPSAAISAQTSAANSSAKAQAKPAVVLTNDNINDSDAKKATQPAASNAQSDPKPAQSENPQAKTPQAAQPEASPVAAQKPKLVLEPRKVLDNENLPGVLDKRGVNVVGTAAGLEGIYDCDVNCYNQARQSANVYPSNDLSWMRDLHAGIDKLQDDDAWRAHLVKLVDLRSQYCKLAVEEARALERVDNEQNVTDEQISIREDYNRKVAELGQEFQAEYGRASMLEAKWTPLVRGFMQLQERRITSTGCVSPVQYRYNADPEERDE